MTGPFSGSLAISIRLFYHLERLPIRIPPPSGSGRSASDGTRRIRAPERSRAASDSWSSWSGRGGPSDLLSRLGRVLGHHRRHHSGRRGVAGDGAVAHLRWSPPCALMTGAAAIVGTSRHVRHLTPQKLGSRRRPSPPSLRPSLSCHSADDRTSSPPARSARTPVAPRIRHRDPPDLRVLERPTVEWHAPRRLIQL